MIDEIEDHVLDHVGEIVTLHDEDALGREQIANAFRKRHEIVHIGKDVVGGDDGCRSVRLPDLPRKRRGEEGRDGFGAAACSGAGDFARWFHAQDAHSALLKVFEQGAVIAANVDYQGAQGGTKTVAYCSGILAEMVDQSQRTRRHVNVVAVQDLRGDDVPATAKDHNRDKGTGRSDRHPGPLPGGLPEHRRLQWARALIGIQVPACGSRRGGKYRDGE